MHARRALLFNVSITGSVCGGCVPASADTCHDPALAPGVRQLAAVRVHLTNQPVVGSGTELVGGLPAARTGSTTARGGTVTVGTPAVLVL